MSKHNDPNKYPKGWNRRKVESVIAHYEKQSEADAVLEDEAMEQRKEQKLRRFAKKRGGKR